MHESSVESAKKAIVHYEKAIESLSESGEDKKLLGAAYFRMGVAFRALYDLSDVQNQKADWFTKAASSWTNALNLNPNQYIWRRRIQQYGPRQMKPYPFYDWVEQAKNEIVQRGEKPVELTVKLTGAEIAKPKRGFDSATEADNPDPSGKITRDKEQIVNIDSTVVPQQIKPGGTVRVHLRFDASGGHWNNEAEPMVVWLETSENGIASTSSLTHPNSNEASSDEVRNLEFEFKTNADQSGVTKPKGIRPVLRLHIRRRSVSFSASGLRNPN